MKPNSGVLLPNKEVQIDISLRSFEFYPNDKFLVQSMFAPDGEINQASLWKEIDQNEVMESKLRCVFPKPPTQKDNGLETHIFVALTIFVLGIMLGKLFFLGESSPQEDGGVNGIGLKTHIFAALIILVLLFVSNSKPGFKSIIIDQQSGELYVKLRGIHF